MTKDEFIDQYKVTSIPKDEFLKTQVVLECDCGETNCKGWAMVSNTPLAIKSHMELYYPEKSQRDNQK